MAGELPDFHLPHAEKIEWMIETDGYALEVVAPDAGQRPAASRVLVHRQLPRARRLPRRRRVRADAGRRSWLLGLVRDTLAAGTEIPIGAEVVGLLDNELRCCFAPVDLAEWGALFATAQAWYRGEDFEIVQLVYPDRNGFLPYEAGFDQRLRFAQPVIGHVCGRSPVDGDDGAVRASTERWPPRRRSIDSRLGRQGAGQSSHSHSTPCSSSSSRNGSALNASGPSTPAPLQAPVASISIATAGITAVCQTTAW